EADQAVGGGDDDVVSHGAHPADVGADGGLVEAGLFLAGALVEGDEAAGAVGACAGLAEGGAGGDDALAGLLDVVDAAELEGGVPEGMAVGEIEGGGLAAALHEDEGGAVGGDDEVGGADGAVEGGVEAVVGVGTTRGSESPKSEENSGVF